MKDEYCAVVSAVDLLGNESDLPNAEDHDDDAAGTCMGPGGPAVEDETPARRQCDTTRTPYGYDGVA